MFILMTGLAMRTILIFAILLISPTAHAQSHLQNDAPAFIVMLLVAVGIFILIRVAKTSSRSKKHTPATPIQTEPIKPAPPRLPPPILPSRPTTTPVQGIMRVDVTQTSKTVDVFIVLSEEAKFIVENNGLGELPIEENFDGLKKHMVDFTDDYDFETDKPITDDTPQRTPWTTSGMIEQNIHKQVMEEANVLHKVRRQASRKYELEDEIERYKNAYTVRLSTYLSNPYRKQVANPIEASAYINRLEKEYLPLIKSIIETASLDKATRSYDY